MIFVKLQNGNVKVTTAGGDTLIGINDTVSNGTLIAAFSVGAKGNVSVNLSDFDIRVPPSLTITIAAKVVSGAASNVTAAFTYYEDI